MKNLLLIFAISFALFSCSDDSDSGPGNTNFYGGYKVSTPLINAQGSVTGLARADTLLNGYTVMAYKGSELCASAQITSNGIFMFPKIENGTYDIKFKLDDTLSFTLKNKDVSKSDSAMEFTNDSTNLISPSAYCSLSGYPSPFSNYLTIDVKIPQASYINVKLVGPYYNNLPIFAGNLNAGEFSLNADFSKGNYSSGVYFIVMYINGKALVTPIVKIAQ